MNGLVIFKGKYGATRQYADWIGEALHVPVVASVNCNPEQLTGKDFVILGSSVYVGKPLLTDWLMKNLTALKGKKIYLFLVAATPPSESDKMESYVKTGVPEEIRANCEVFYFHGRMILRKLSWSDRFMMKMLARLVKDGAEHNRLLADFDSVKKENIESLVIAIKREHPVECSIPSR